MKLTKYWFKFDITLTDSPPPGTLLGCGVTAANRDEALQIIRDLVFKNKPIPGIKDCIENIDVSMLDKKHVLPNMGNPALMGIWFPLGY